MSLADELVNAINFGDETVTLRMGEKYRGQYRPGSCVFVTPGGVRIPITITEVPAEPIEIGRLSPELIRRNGVKLSHSPKEDELQQARLAIAENMRHWYPTQEHHGLQTKVFAIGFEGPPLSEALRTIRAGIVKVIGMYFDAQTQVSYCPGRGSDPGEVDLLFVNFTCLNASTSKRKNCLAALNALVGVEDSYREYLGDAPRVMTSTNRGDWCFARGRAAGNFQIVCDPAHLRRVFDPAKLSAHFGTSTN
jgi:hypothetical protein